MSVITKQSFTVVFVLFALSLLFNSCGEDDIIQPGVHFQPRGIYIQPEGLPDTLVYYHNGSFMSGKDSLFVTVSDTSEHLDIRFLDMNRNEIPPPSLSVYSLGLEISNESIARAFTEGSWAFHIIGVSPGETSLVIKVLHMGHSDFTTLPIKIRVIP